MQERLRVAIIGAGMIANAGHIPAWRALADEAEIVAIASRTLGHAEDTAARHAIPAAYDDYRQMLREVHPDVVSVCTPNAFHVEPAVAALEAGAHVLCEKPVATSLADATAMFDAAERAGRLLLVGQNARFAAVHQAARELVASGRLGTVYYAETAAMRRRGVPTWGVFHLSEYSGGGPVFDLGVHVLDALLWIMGNPRVTAVSATTYRMLANRDEGLVTSLSEAGAPMGVYNPRPFHPGEVDVEDMATAFLRLEGGAAVGLKVSWAANVPEALNDTILVGTEGGLRLRPPTLIAPVGRYLADAVLDVPSDPDAPFHGIWREVEHFVRAVRGEEELLVRRDEVLNVIGALEAIYTSAREGREVPVGPPASLPARPR